MPDGDGYLLQQDTDVIYTLPVQIGSGISFDVSTATDLLWMVLNNEVSIACARAYACCCWLADFRRSAAVCVTHVDPL